MAGHRGAGEITGAKPCNSLPARGGWIGEAETGGAAIAKTTPNAARRAARATLPDGEGVAACDTLSGKWEGKAYRKSGGTASASSIFSASSNRITTCSCEPSRRIETVFSSASRLPSAKITGTFATECSRTL